MTNLASVVENAIDTLREWAKDNPGCDPGYDGTLHEIADNSVPVYTFDLLECAQSYLWLATEEPENGPAFDGSPTAVNIIAANIFEYVENKLYEAWAEIEQELEEEAEEDSEEDSDPLTADDYLSFIGFDLYRAGVFELEGNQDRADTWIELAEYWLNKYLELTA